jgi:hypothetical protein
VRVGNRDSIRFESIPAGQAFEVVFDPFKHGSVPGDTNKKYTLDASLFGDSPGSKTYSFSVVARGCKTLDPIIVVDH